MNKSWNAVAGLAVGVLAGLSVVAAAAAEAVALVADVAGAVQIASSTRDRDGAALRLMQAVAADSRLTLARHAQVTLFVPASGTAYELSGPGAFEVGPQGVRPLAGAAAPIHRQLDKALRAIRIERAGLVQAGVVMRSALLADQPELIEPRGVLVVPDGPRFKWASLGEGREYRFRLLTLTGEVIHEQRTMGLEISLPPQTRLTEGDRYLWSVLDARSSGSRSPTQWCEIVVATSSQRAEIKALGLDREVQDPAERNLRQLLRAQVLDAPR